MPGAELGHVGADLLAAQDAVRHQGRQLGELLLAEAEAGHFADAHTQCAGGGEALLVRGGLIVDDDVVVLQTVGDLRALAVANGDDDLMGLGIVDGGVAHHVQTLGLQASGEGLGILDDGLLVLVLELVHLIGGHQHAHLGAQMVVGHAAGEGTGLDGFPQTVLQILLLVVDADDAALRTEEGLVGGAGDDLRALGKGVLEVVADEAQHVGHIVHDGGGDLLLIHELADGGHRLLVQHHALAEDDQLRAVALDELLGLLHVHLIGVVGADGEVHHGGLFGDGVDGDVVMQRTHGLSGQVAALDDVVVHHVAKALSLHLAVEAVLPVHQGGEYRHVGHLTAESTGLYLGAAEVGAHLLHQQLLHLVDELRALIVEDILIVEGQHLLVLGVAAAGVAAGQDADGAAGGILGGDQVDALLLPPLVVLQRLGQQLQRLGSAVAAAHLVFLLLHAVDEGTGVGRRGHAHVAGGNDGLQPLAAHVHLHGVVLQNVAVDVAQADSTLAAGLQNDGLKALALALEVGHHGAAGDPAHQLVALIDLHTGTHDAAIQQRDRRDLPGQDAQVAEVTIHVPDEGLVLLFQRLAADEVALFGGKADGELGQGHGKNGDLAAIGGAAHLVAVQGQGGLQTQGVAGAQTGGTCAQLNQAVPQPRGFLAADIDLIAQRLAGVAGLGHAGGVALQ